LYSFGLLSESRTWAGRFELLRLTVIVPLGMAGIMQRALIDAQFFGPLWTATIVYILVSAATLRIATNSFDAVAIADLDPR
jgi:hypothetical protein